MALIEERINAFQEIQKLPYRLSRNGINDCNCVTKSKLFGEKLTELGLKWRYGLVEFSWASLNIPDDIIAISHDEPGVHQHVEVLIPEIDIWEIVDPTWDPGLKNILPIPEWDGMSSTKSAVPVIRTLTQEESNELYERVKTEEFRTGWFQRNNDFIEALNKWFENVRKN